MVTSRGNFEFEEVLPRLVAAYETGRLVPFIGMGMSRPLCADWPDFIRRLEEEADRVRAAETRHKTDMAGVAISPPITAETKPEELVQRANFAVERLRRAAPNKLAEGLHRALFPGAPKVPPMQTAALARIAWPLVLTTNYDNAYVCSYEDKHGPGGLAVIGRETEDCQRVLNSLTTAGRSLLWALQGHLGEPFQVSTQDHDRRLSSQAVVDYSEYRRVTHREPHFRRAFAEVFRHRSLFFLGSGLRENYLQELFGEVLEIYGPSSRTHFAIMPKEEVDPRFMYERFQIAIVEYEVGEHRRVPDFLDRLRGAIESSDAAPVSWRWGRSRVVSDLVEASHDDLEIVRGPLPMVKEDDTCLAVSAGGARPDSPFIISSKNTIRATLAKWGVANVDSKLEESDDDGYVGKYAGAHAFAVRARPPGVDKKDLSQIAPASTALFDVAANDYRCIRMQLLAAGGSASAGAPWSVRPFPARFSFIQIVRAWGTWRRAHPDNGCRLALHVIDTALTREIASGRIDVLEILRCDDIRFWAEVVDSPDKLDRRLFQCRPEKTTLRFVCDELGLSTPVWELEVSPPPTSDANDFMHKMLSKELLDSNLDKLFIVPGSTLHFHRREP
jgi:hypothetical protein